MINKITFDLKCLKQKNTLEQTDLNDTNNVNQEKMTHRQREMTNYTTMNNFMHVCIQDGIIILDRQNFLLVLYDCTFTSTLIVYIFDWKFRNL